MTPGGASRKSSSKGNRKNSSKTRNIEQYDHKDKQRVNNPPVGLMDEKTDVDKITIVP